MVAHTTAPPAIRPMTTPTRRTPNRPGRFSMTAPLSPPEASYRRVERRKSGVLCQQMATGPGGTLFSMPGGGGRGAERGHVHLVAFSNLDMVEADDEFVTVRRYQDAIFLGQVVEHIYDGWKVKL